MELVTGRAGSPHITSQQDRQKHQGIWGTGAYILKTGNNLEPVVQSSNNIQIKDGALMSQGALFSVKVGTVDEVTIANGSQGMQRKDVIVARYTYNQGENTEKAEWAVVQGTPVASNPQIPQITEGDIQDGDATVDTAVFIVTLDGINITAVDVVPETAPDMEEIKEMLSELNGKMKWKLLQSITGSGVITLPDNYDELLAIAIADSTDNYSKYSVQIPHDLLSAQQEWHRFKAGSYSSTAYNSEAVVRVKEDSMQLASFYINGANRVDTCGLRVYYR